MTTETLTRTGPFAPISLIRAAFRDFRSQADPRREILWNVGRLLLIATFAGIYSRDPGNAADFAAAATISAVGATVSLSSIWLVLNGRVFPAFLLGTTNDLLGFFLGWTALMVLGPEGTAGSEGWLALFPVLISLPYRLGSMVGMIAGVSILAWLGGLHYALLPSDSEVLTVLPQRWGTLLVTLAIASALNFALTRRTEELTEQKNRSELLKGQSEAKSEFIDTVSHELRTPITVILALTRRLMSRSAEKLGPEEAEHLKVAVRNANQLSELIADLLMVSQIERGNLETRISSFSLNRFIAESCVNLEPVTSARSQTIKMSCPGAETEIHSDRGRLTQVMNNLLTNASKYSADGSEIAVQVSTDAQFVHVEVANPAGELDESSTSEMFEMFFRADNEQTRAMSGTGLGLYICRRIISSLNGEISAQIGDGRFVVRFSVPR